jgi:hypothetical protein
MCFSAPFAILDVIITRHGRFFFATRGAKSAQVVTSLQIGSTGFLAGYPVKIASVLFHL